MKQLDIALLPALDALLTNANVTRAAAQLGISQPALSVKLARLRDLTGDALLVSSGKGRGMVLTPYGSALRRRVGAALEAVGLALESEPFDPRTSSTTFRIIANDNAASLAVAVILARLTEHAARGVRLALLRPNDRPLADRLAAGEADLAISADEAPPGGERLHRRVLFRDRYATAQRKGHPRGTEALDLDSFCALDHVIVSESGDFEGSIDAALGRLGRERRVALSLHGYLLAPSVVATSDLVVTLPKRLFDQHVKRLDLFDTPLALPEIELSAFWHERTDGDAGNAWLRASLFNHC